MRARLLHQMDRHRSELVILAILPPLVFAAGGQPFGRIAADGEGVPVPLQHLLGDRLDADALDPGGGAGKVFVDDRLIQAHGLEDLRAAIALDGGNPHFGHRLHHPLGGGLDDIFHRRRLIDAGEQPFGEHLLDVFENQVRIDGAGAIADEKGVLVDIARFGGFEDQPDQRPGPLPDQVMVQAGHRQQRRHRRHCLRHPAVGEDQQRDPLGDGGIGAAAQFGERFFQPGCSLCCRKQNRQGRGLQPRPVDAAQLLQFVVADDRGGQLDLPARLRLRMTEVALGAQGSRGGGDDFLANAVDGRIGDLGEELFEIGIEQLRLFRQHGQRRIVAHGADRLDAVGCHRRQPGAQILEGVAEGLLPLQQGRRFRRRLRIDGGQLFQVAPGSRQASADKAGR